VKLVAAPGLIVTNPVEALNETPEFAVFMERVIGAVPVAVTVSKSVNPAVPATDNPPVLESVGPFG
jgi:hypothetical protein